MRHPSAFTLSEVLITLVIIGIIAAITIPSISKASEKYILKNQFKKTYSTLLNAMNKADTDLGGNTQCYYYHGAGSTIETRSDCFSFYDQIFANLNVQKICKGNAKADGCIPTPYLKKYVTVSGESSFYQSAVENSDWVYNLADGTILIMYGTHAYPVFIVDINGAKGPNTYGKDVFNFKMAKDGNKGFQIDFDNMEEELRKEAYFTTLSDIYNE